MHVSPACVFTMYVPGTHRGQKEAPNPLELGIPDACAGKTPVHINIHKNFKKKERKEAFRWCSAQALAA